jgi:hypothetical protein
MSYTFANLSSRERFPRIMKPPHPPSTAEAEKVQ